MTGWCRMGVVLRFERQALGMVVIWSHERAMTSVIIRLMRVSMRM